VNKTERVNKFDRYTDWERLFALASGSDRAEPCEEWADPLSWREQCVADWFIKLCGEIERTDEIGHRSVDLAADVIEIGLRSLGLGHRGMVALCER
jgi:hypothetical protein